MKILVVEDDHLSREILIASVEKLGHQCIGAKDGQEGWEQFQRSQFEVVISDMLMPVLDGRALCQRIRSESEGPYCYFILLSSCDQRSDVLDGLQAGADDYLTKPLDFEELQARLVSAERVTSLHGRLTASQLQAAAQSKMASVGLLAAGVAHELNTPLGAIVLHLEGCLGQLDNPARLEGKIQSCLSASRRMKAIVAQLLHYSTENPREIGFCRLDQLVQETLSLLGPELRAGGAELNVSLEEVGVEACSAELQQVLINLLVNARDANQSISPAGQAIRVETSREAGFGVLAVLDQGPGISGELATKVFDPFFSSKEVGKGTGLGLSISKTLVEKNGGTLSFDCGPEQGCRFQLKLPEAR